MSALDHFGNWRTSVLVICGLVMARQRAIGMADDLSEHEQRHLWRLRWLSSLEAFADSAVQASRWTDPQEGNPHFSFVECMCCYFDDADLGDEGAYARHIARGYVSDGEAEAVIEFHQFADAYRPPNGDDYDVDAILADPNWGVIVDAAQRAQARLLALLTDPAEIAALTRPSVWKPIGNGYKGQFPAP